MTVKGYDSLEAMFKDLDANKRRADAAIQPWQAELTFGDHWVRLEPHVGVLIYGAITRSPYPEDAPVEEEAMSNGYVVGSCYSVLCAEGEVGNTHRATIHQKLNQEQFETAKVHGWPQSVEALVAVLAGEVQ